MSDIIVVDVNGNAIPCKRGELQVDINTQAQIMLKHGVASMGIENAAAVWDAVQQATIQRLEDSSGAIMTPQTHEAVFDLVAEHHLK